MRTPRVTQLWTLVAALVMAATSSAQTVTTLAGSGEAGDADGDGAAASFRWPIGLAVDSSGTVYVGDVGNYAIRKVSPEGRVTTFFRSRDIGDDFTDIAAFGLAVDPRGAVYAVDPGDSANYIQLVSPDGVADVIAGGNPAAVAIDARGQLWVLEYRAGLATATPDGVFTMVAPGITGSEIATDLAGNVYVSSWPQNLVWKVAPGGLVTRLAGSDEAGSADGMGEAASFREPRGLATDVSGNVYVADVGNNLIRKITPEGAVTTLAGSGSEESVDGVGRAASFARPAGLALDCAGNLYATELGSHRIRRILVEEGAGSAGGVPCEGRWIVPSVARVRGAHGSSWTSDLTVHNRGSSATTVTLRFLGNGDDTRGLPEASVTLEPQRSVTVTDVLLSVFGIEEGFGALDVDAGNGRIVVRSRTWTAGAGGSLGDNVPGLKRADLFTDRSPRAPVLAGLREDGAFRSNLVLVNGARIPITLVVRATDAAGAALGEIAYTLPPLGMRQDTRFLARPELGGGGRANVTVTVSSPTRGAAFSALATVIDNTSNDPTTVLPQ